MKHAKGIFIYNSKSSGRGLTYAYVRSDAKLTKHWFAGLSKCKSHKISKKGLGFYSPSRGITSYRLSDKHFSDNSHYTKNNFILYIRIFIFPYTRTFRQWSNILFKHMSGNYLWVLDVSVWDLAEKIILPERVIFSKICLLFQKYAYYHS